MTDNYILLKDKNKPFVYNRIYCDIYVFDSDFMMSCPDRICAECGDNHSFTGDFEDVSTSIDILSKDLKGNIKSEVFLS